MMDAEEELRREVKGPSSRFVKVVCDCKNEQIIFGKASKKEINCLVCGKQLAKSSGGKTIIRSKILEVLD